jgi:hypothetical protein
VTQRGRKSYVSTLLQPLAPVAYEGERPKPPKTLDKSERGIWKYIVGCMQPDYFPPETLPLLADLCRHISTSEWLAGELTVLKQSSLADAANLKKVAKVLSLQATESQLIQRAMTRLRLTTQSRYDPDKANRKSQREPGPTGVPKPWERDAA